MLVAAAAGAAAELELATEARSAPTVTITCAVAGRSLRAGYGLAGLIGGRDGAGAEPE